MMLERLMREPGGDSACENLHWESFVQAGGIASIIKVVARDCFREFK